MRLSATICLLFAWVVCASCATEETASPHPRGTSAAPPKITETSPTTVAPRDDDSMSELRAGLETVASESGVEVGVSVVGLGGESERLEAGVDEDAVFESASLIKLLVLAELLRQADAGLVSLDEPLGSSDVGTLAEAMISSSDNAATNLLIDRVGFESINSLARDIGLEDTILARKMLDFDARTRGEDNFTSALDVTTLLAAIWEGGLLSPSSREFAVSALENQTLDSKLPASLPTEARILHKTGELENIEHDAGIVILPDDRAIAIAVLTSGDSASGIEAIRRVGVLSYEYFATPRQ